MKTRRVLQLRLFCLLFIVYTLTNSGTFHIIDEVSLFAVTESVAQRGAVDTNAIAWSQWVNSPGEVLGAFGPDGEVYSKKGPAPAFLAVPWYLLVRLFAALGLPWGLLQGALLWNGIVTAATAVLLWSTAVRMGYPNRVGTALALIFGVATIAWPYANHLFGEPLSAFGILLCFYGLVRMAEGRQKAKGKAQKAKGEGVEDDPAPQPAIRDPQLALLAGLGAALMLTTVTAHALLVAVFGVYLLWTIWRGEDAAMQRGEDAERRRGEEEKRGSAIRNPQLATRPSQSISQTHHPITSPRLTHYALLITSFSLPLLLAGVLLLLYNAARFGHPLDTGYHFDSGEGFTTPFWQGFWGLIFSPYRGVFWHTPVFVLSLLAFPAFVRRHRAEGSLIAALSIVLVTMYSLWWMWWGGFAWGPRFLVPMTPLWILLLAPVLGNMMIEDLRLGTRKRLVQPILYSSFIVLSFLVQLSSVVVNYVNYEIKLRQIFPTDWVDPLRFGPPAQRLADLALSPVFGQWRLMAENFVANSDLAWLWPDGTVQWSVVIVGAVALALTLGTGDRGLATGDRRDGVESTSSSAVLSGVFRLSSSVSVLAVVAVTAVWLTAAGRHPVYAAPGYRAILDEVAAAAGDGDALVTIAPYHYHIPMNWFGRGLPIFGYAADSMDHPETAQVLAAALADYGQIWYVTAGLPPAEPNNTVERWLAEQAFKADDRWFDDFRLVRYATENALGEAALRPLTEALSNDANRVAITGVRLPASAAPGTTLPVALHFRVENVSAPLRWFVQLLGADGAPLALLDTAPLDGYASFAELPVGVELVERAGLTLPTNMASGSYRLIAGIYDPAREGAPRLQTQGGGDVLDLGTVQIP